MDRRGGRKASSSSAANGCTENRGNTRNRRPRGHSHPAQSRSDRRVWGNAPHAEFTQSGLTKLFDAQKRLNAALRKQAKLAKLAVGEVRSTQAEQLRRVNEEILRVSSSGSGIVNPFSSRNLTHAQMLSEDMIKRSGKRVIKGASVTRPTQPSKFPIRKHRRDCTKTSEDAGRCPSPLECFTLRGPLLRDFSRAKERGYKGPASRWLLGSRAQTAIDRLREKGFTFLHPREVGMFHPQSPLHWAVSSHSSVQQHNLRHGFRGERLHSQPTNFVTLRRQAASVKRLKLSDWPCSEQGRSWPTFPTLNESWEMVARGKYLYDHTNNALLSKLLRETKRPTKLVKPGASERTIRRLLIGVRADVEVPRKFLCYFQYRWGFLILQRKHFLPKELIKFLADRWKKDFTRMFLVGPVRYNDALRRLSDSDHWALSGFVRGSVPKLVQNSRQRKRIPRGARRELAKSTTHGSTITGKTSKGTPSPDKSDGGVRLF